MTIDEQIKILEAARDGKRIEVECNPGDWREADIPMIAGFNFMDHRYRIAEPKLVKKNVDIIMLVHEKTGEIRMVGAPLVSGHWRPVKFYGEWVVEE